MAAPAVLYWCQATGRKEQIMARHYTREVLAQLAQGDFVAVASMGPGDTVTYRPRNSHDSRPWTDGVFRYSGREIHVTQAHCAHARAALPTA